MTKVEWLLDNIELDLNTSSRNTLKYRKAMHFYHLLSLVLTAGIMVSTGISGFVAGKELALILGAIASIIAGIQLSERFYDRIFNWATYHNELTAIKQRLEFYVIGKEVESNSEDDQEVKKLFDEYLIVTKKFDNKWTAHFSKQQE